MVPIGLFERVMPLDVMPTFLLRALLMDDLGRVEHGYIDNIISIDSARAPMFWKFCFSLLVSVAFLCRSSPLLFSW